jgi:hypothetical protein
VTDFQEFLPSENVGSVRVVFVEVEQGILSGVLEAVVEFREL